MGVGFRGLGRSVQKQGVSFLDSPGILGMVELGAQSIVYELAIIVYMVSECHHVDMLGVPLAWYSASGVL